MTDVLPAILVHVHPLISIYMHPHAPTYNEATLLPISLGPHQHESQFDMQDANDNSQLKHLKSPGVGVSLPASNPLAPPPTLQHDFVLCLSVLPSTIFQTRRKKTVGHSCKVHGGKSLAASSVSSCWSDIAAFFRIES